MTQLHQSFVDAYAMQSTRHTVATRQEDPAYRRRTLARRLRPLARAVASLTVATLATLTLWLLFVVVAALPL